MTCDYTSVASVTFSGDEIVSCVNITMTDFPIILIIGKLPEDHVVAGNSKATVYGMSEKIYTLTQRRSEAYADAHGIPSTYVYTMMSWLREFWSGSGRPLKCLRTLPLQFSKSLDG